MRRRTYLASVAATTTAIAGCTGDVEEPESGGNGGGGSGGSDPTPTATETTAAVQHEIGESFVVGDGAKSVRYQVNDVFTVEEVGSGQLAQQPDGIFVVVILQMENVGDETLDITTRHLLLIDEQERTFESDTEASIYAEQDARIEAEPITFDQLQPGLEVTRSVIYDVPPGQGYALLIEPVGILSGADEHFVVLGQA